MDINTSNVAYSMEVGPKDGPNRPSRSRKCDPSARRKSRCCKRKRQTINEITQSLSANCCCCCTTLAKYMRESGKLLSSCLTDTPTDTKLCEIFTQLVASSSKVGGDMLNLIKYLFNLLCVIGDRKR